MMMKKNDGKNVREKKNTTKKKNQSISMSNNCMGRRLLAM
jgi:hypothetical protein